MDVISILRKKKQPVISFEVKLHANQADVHPKVSTRVVIEYLVTGREVNETTVCRAIELSADKYCPAQAMLRKAFPTRLFYKFLDENTKLPLREGEYIQKLTDR